MDACLLSVTIMPDRVKRAHGKYSRNWKIEKFYGFSVGYGLEDKL